MCAMSEKSSKYICKFPHHVLVAITRKRQQLGSKGVLGSFKNLSYWASEWSVLTLTESDRGNSACHTTRVRLIVTCLARQQCEASQWCTIHSVKSDVSQCSEPQCATPSSHIFSIVAFSLELTVTAVKRMHGDHWEKPSAMFVVLHLIWKHHQIQIKAILLKQLTLVLIKFHVPSRYFFFVGQLLAWC